MRGAARKMPLISSDKNELNIPLVTMFFATFAVETKNRFPFLYI